MSSGLHIGLDELRRNWFWFLLLGLALIVVGGIAIIYSVAVTVGSMIFLGALLLVTGVVELANTFQARRAGSVLLHLLAAVLDGVLGALFVFHPVNAAEVLTLLMAVGFLVGGSFRLVAAAVIQPPSWLWLLLSGLISVLLGGMLLSNFPYAGLWFIGLCIGIDLIGRGVSWVFLALAVKSAPGGMAV